jgi:hypothetical protein
MAEQIKKQIRAVRFMPRSLPDFPNLGTFQFIFSKPWKKHRPCAAKR